MKHFRSLGAVLLWCCCSARPAPAAAAPQPEVMLGSGRYEASSSATLVWQPKAFAGPVTVAETAGGNRPVAVGQTLVVLSAEGLPEALAEAKRALAQAKQATVQQQEDSAALGPDQEIALQKARAELAAASERNAYWRAKERADAVQRSTDNLENAEAGVKDDREELRQLEQMYKEARIDSSTQDLVVGRERRKLRLSESNLEIVRRQQKHYLDVELPRQDEALALAEKEAQLRLDGVLRKAERARKGQADALAGAKRAEAEAARKVADLEADAAALTMKATIAGRLGDWAVKVGDHPKAGQELATIWSDQPGQVRFEAQTAALPSLPVGATVRLRFPELNQATLAGQVAEVGWCGRAEGGKTLFAVVVRAKGPVAGARPGLKVEVIK